MDGDLFLDECWDRYYDKKSNLWKLLQDIDIFLIGRPSYVGIFSPLVSKVRKHLNSGPNKSSSSLRQRDTTVLYCINNNI